jgi:MFS superfamily sulfate permease-like transporter
MFKHFSNDLSAGLVVFLVAVPLCLGIALASGAPLFSGIIAGIIGGIVVGGLSGSSLGVSGPAAGLAVIVADAIMRLGTDAEGIFHMEVGFPLFLTAVFLGGLMQLVLAFARAGIIGYFFPNAVIKGMLSAIGIIIILKQIPHALGHDVIAEGLDSFWQSDGENTFSELWVAAFDVNPAALIITSISLLILVLWEQKFMKQIRLFQIIQGPLIVVVVGIVLSYIFSGIDTINLKPDEMVGLPILGAGDSLQSLLVFPDWTGLFRSDVWIIGATIAVVASLETLLCVEATDKLDPAKNVTPTNRELLAQGTGNALSGLIGGLPITQVIVRSSANIQSGGKTKMSAIIHGFMLLAAALLIPSVMNMIPLSSLAAILFLVGYKLAKPSIFKAMYKEERTQFITFIVTVLSIVFTDLLLGICIGLAVGVFMILYKNYSVPFSFSETQDPDQPIVIKLSENVTFLNKASILQALKVIPKGSKVVIDATQSHYIHPDIIEIIQDFIDHCTTCGTMVCVEGDFDEVNFDHLNYFMKKVSLDSNKPTSYIEQVLKN